MRLFFINSLILLITVQAFAQEPIKFDPVQAEQFLNAPTPAPIPAPQPVPVAPPTPPPAPVVPVVPVVEKITYEEFLNSIEALAKSVMPEKGRLDSLKAIANAETLAPKDEFEKQMDYDKKVADFEKSKQQNMQKLDEEYKAKTKEQMDKIKASITSKEDLQPAWAGMLNKDASSIKEYGERSAKILGKISEMKLKIVQVSELLGHLNFSQSEIGPITKQWQQKNQLYISRLERAVELMQDYSVQERAKILTTDKKKVKMTLGSYNAEKETFDISINDSTSQVVAPFDFSGAIEMPPEQARETNKQTDNFTVSIDYINYPFIVNGANIFPGTKQVHVYYKDNELQAKGSFTDIKRLSKINSYAHWKVYADSLLSGKLAPKNLDSTYAMRLDSIIEEEVKIAKSSEAASDASSSGELSFTTREKVRIAAFALAIVSFGIGASDSSRGGFYAGTVLCGIAGVSTFFF